MQATHPDKQLVRDLMRQHREENTLPLTLEEMRRALGWFLIPENKVAAK